MPTHCVYPIDSTNPITIFRLPYRKRHITCRRAFSVPPPRNLSILRLLFRRENIVKLKQQEQTISSARPLRGSAHAESMAHGIKHTGIIRYRIAYTERKTKKKKMK